jgi:hypothetical protein
MSRKLRSTIAAGGIVVTAMAFFVVGSGGSSVLAASDGAATTATEFSAQQEAPRRIRGTTQKAGRSQAAPPRFVAPSGPSPRIVGPRGPTPRVVGPQGPVPRVVTPRVVGPNVAAPRLGSARITGFRGSGPRIGGSIRGPIRLGGRGVSFIRGPRYVNWHGSRRRLIAIGAISTIILGGIAYYPYAYLPVEQPYCEGYTEDGCELRWQEVATEDGLLVPQCVAFCPFR